MSLEVSEPLLLFKRILNKIGRPYGINPFPRAFELHLSNDTTNCSSIFNKIYENNLWGSSQSRSGPGSEINFTSRYRTELSTLLRERNIRSVFDAPCGDLTWMYEIIMEHQLTYMGGDISHSLVDNLKKNPKLDIRYFDICEDPFPDAKVWHCRDCLFHLPFNKIKQALENFADSNIPYALLTTHRAHFLHKNLDVSVGGFRFLDLERAPINLPKALHYLQDYRKGIDFPRFVGLWSREDVATALTLD